MAHSYTVEGIVLKRSNYSEADRLITLFTRQQGKVIALAKGARKLTSRKKGSLEPASYAYFHLVEHHQHFIITEARLIESYQELQGNLVRVTQTLEFLEIVNALTGEGQELADVFTHVIGTLDLLKGEGAKKELLLGRISQLLYLLGFTPDNLADEMSLKDTLETIMSKTLKSKKFLTVAPARVE